MKCENCINSYYIGNELMSNRKLICKKHYDTDIMLIHMIINKNKCKDFKQKGEKKNERK